MRREARRVLRPAVAAALTAALLGAAAGDAVAAGGKALKPRSQVDQIPGDYIQLDTLWVPILKPTGTLSYLGLVVRLWPGDETRYKACVQAPWVAEAIQIYFNDHPLDRGAYEDDARLTKAITAVATDTAGKATYRKAEIFRAFVAPDEASADLSATCR